MAPLIVIVAGLLLPEYEPLPLPVQDENVYPPLGVAWIDTPVPESYHPVSPGIVGGVVAAEVPPPEGELTKVTWCWVAELKLTTCDTVIEIRVVVTVPVVATFVLGPPSTFHEASLVPVPDARPQTPLEDTVSESPYLYQPSEVSDARE
jgi:hypothetical protein